MKVTYVIPSLGEGGAEIRAIERLNFLVKFYSVNVELIILSNNIPLISLVEKHSNLKVHILKLKNTETFSKKALFFSYMNFYRLTKRIVKFKPDVVVSSLPISHQITRLALLAIPIKRRPKVLLYHHSMQYYANPVNTFAKKLLHLQVKFLSRKIDDAHIFISNAVKENISTHLDIKNSYVLYNAIPDKYNHALELSTPLNNNKFNIIIPGRLTPVKGHLPALKAISSFLKSYPQAMIWIIGEGTERSKIEEFARKNHFHSQIKLQGNLTHELLLRYMYDSDTVLIPSLNEGLGNVAIESLMMGATVISSNAGGLKEIVNRKEIGFLFEKGKFNDIIPILERVIENPKLLDGKIIRNSYLERFNFKNHVKRFYEILNDV